MQISDPKDSSSSPTYKWWVVFMLWCICFFNYADRQAISVVLPKLQEVFHFDKEQQGYIASAFMWIYAAGAPIAGYVGDRIRRKDLILGGCLFWSLITVLTGWCGKLWQFVTVRALEGFGETFYFPASMSLISDYHSGKTRSRAMSLHQSSVYIGTIGGSWFAAWLAQRYNWRWGFYFFGLAGMTLAVLLYNFLREARRGQSEIIPSPGPIQDSTGGIKSMNVAQPPSAVELASGVSRLELILIPSVLLTVLVCPTAWWTGWQKYLLIPAAVLSPMALWSMLGKVGLRSPTPLLLLLAFMGANSVATIFLMWTPTFLKEKFNFSLTSAGLNGSIYIQVASALSVPLGGISADWLSRRFAGGRMMVQVTGLLLGAPFVYLVGKTGEVATLILAMSVFGFCKGLYDANIFASMYDVVPPQSRASAAGMLNFIGWGGGALGPLLFGRLAAHGSYGSEVANMSHAISFGGGIYLASATLILVAVLFFAKKDLQGAQAPC